MELKALHEVLRSGWTVLGIVTFLAIAVWAFWPSNKAKFEKRGRIPFDER